MGTNGKKGSRNNNNNGNNNGNNENSTNDSNDNNNVQKVEKWSAYVPNEKIPLPNDLPEWPITMEKEEESNEIRDVIKVHRKWIKYLLGSGNTVIKKLSEESGCMISI